MSLPEGVDDAFGNWLAGFIDGEGCFFFHKRLKQFSPPQFQLKLRDDDLSILEECVRRTGLGQIKSVDRSGRSHPQSEWRITKRSDCTVLVAILDRYPLRAKKRRDFDIWREAVSLWALQKKNGLAGGGATKYDDSEIIVLRERLKLGRKYSA